MFFSPSATTCPFVDFVVPPPGHGKSVTDFWLMDAHEAQLRYPDGVWVVIEEDVVPGGALNLNLLTTQTMVTTEIFPFKENSHGRAGNRTRTSWLVVRDSDH